MEILNILPDFLPDVKELNCPKCFEFKPKSINSLLVHYGMTHGIVTAILKQIDFEGLKDYCQPEKNSVLGFYELELINDAVREIKFQESAGNTYEEIIIDDSDEDNDIEIELELKNEFHVKKEIKTEAFSSERCILDEAKNSYHNY